MKKFGARVKEILNGFSAPIEKVDTEAFKKALDDFITDLDEQEERFPADLMRLLRKPQPSLFQLCKMSADRSDDPDYALSVIGIMTSLVSLGKRLLTPKGNYPTIFSGIINFLSIQSILILKG